MGLGGRNPIVFLPFHDGVITTKSLKLYTFNETYQENGGSTFDHKSDRLHQKAHSILNNIIILIFFRYIS